MLGFSQNGYKWSSPLELLTMRSLPLAFSPLVTSLSINNRIPSLSC